MGKPSYSESDFEEMMWVISKTGEWLGRGLKIHLPPTSWLHP
jgi:hypothetical protein